MHCRKQQVAVKGRVTPLTSASPYCAAFQRERKVSPQPRLPAFAFLLRLSQGKLIRFTALSLAISRAFQSFLPSELPSYEQALCLSLPIQSSFGDGGAVEGQRPEERAAAQQVPCDSSPHHPKHWWLHHFKYFFPGNQLGEMLFSELRCHLHIFWEE